MPLVRAISYNSPHNRVRQVERPGELSYAVASSVEEPDRCRLFVRDLGRPGFLATTVGAPSFLRPIFIVVCWRTQPEMGRIDTRRVVALMKNPHTVWDWAVRELPSGSVRHNSSSVSTREQHSAISAMPDMSLPHPAAGRITHVPRAVIAILRLIDLIPKSIFGALCGNPSWHVEMVAGCGHSI